MVPAHRLERPSLEASVEPSNIETERDAYLPSLDGLRAVAVLIVMGSHMLWRSIPGGLGVTLFFFISGFIITRKLTQTRFGAADVLPFYVKRFFRLSPAVFAYIACAAAVAALFAGELPWRDVAATVFYYANYHDFSHVVAKGNWLSPLEMTWSLSVEEHFYFVYPFALLLTRTPTRLIRFLVVVLIAACAWRLALFAADGPSWALYAHTDTRLDSIAYGCLLAALIDTAATRERTAAGLRALGSGPATVAGLAAVGIATGVHNSLFGNTFVYSVQGLGLVPLFCRLFFLPRSASPLTHRFLGSRFMTWTGRLSYSLYLFHVLGVFVAVQFDVPRLPRILGCWGFAFAAAWASARWVEAPGRRFGRRASEFVRRRGGSVFA